MRAVFDRVGSVGRRGRGAATLPTFVTGLVIAFTAASCGVDRVVPGDSTLVLELGGNHGSLRSALQSAGVVITPRRAVGARGAGAGSIGSLLGRERLAPRRDGSGSGAGRGREQALEGSGPGESRDRSLNGGDDRERDSGFDRDDGTASAPPGPAPDVDAPTYREVELQSGQTISHLASQHLGTMRRSHEILELNGWTEAEARRLRIGTLVKIPPR